LMPITSEPHKSQTASAAPGRAEPVTTPLSRRHVQSRRSTSDQRSPITVNVRRAVEAARRHRGTWHPLAQSGSGETGCGTLESAHEAATRRLPRSSRGLTRCLGDPVRRGLRPSRRFALHIRQMWAYLPRHLRASPLGAYAVQGEAAGRFGKTRPGAPGGSGGRVEAQSGSCSWCKGNGRHASMRIGALPGLETAADVVISGPFCGAQRPAIRCKQETPSPW
jgi:hypothetical protein